MPSKFEMQLFPPMTAVILAGTAVFLGVAAVHTRVGSEPAPYVDSPSPDGLYDASVENGSVVNITTAMEHMHWYNVAEGPERIVDARWIGRRCLQVDFKLDPSDGDDTLPRQRTRFADVQIVYRPAPRSER